MIKLFISKRIVVFICISISCNILLSSGINNESKKLLSPLNNDEDWELVKITDDEILLYSKSIHNMELLAMMVNKTISMEPESIKKILIDINNYSNFLSNNKSIETILIERQKDYLDAYQNIRIDFPFIDNRQYWFRMFFDISQGNSLVEWYILDPKLIDKNLLYSKDNNINLKYGAGLWKYKKTEGEKIQISYRLAIDPEGTIPTIFVDMINKVSIINLFRDVLNEASRDVNIKDTQK